MTVEPQQQQLQQQQQQNRTMFGMSSSYRACDLSDDKRFKLAIFCGDAFGPGDFRVKLLADENRLMVEASKSHTDQGVQVTRRISYAHKLPVGVVVENLTAEWVAKEKSLIVQAPLSRSVEA